MLHVTPTDDMYQNDKGSSISVCGLVPQVEKDEDNDKVNDDDDLDWLAIEAAVAKAKNAKSKAS